MEGAPNGGTRLFYQDLRKNDNRVVELLNDFDASYEFLDNNGQTFWFKTDRNAAKGSVIAIDIHQPDASKWKVVHSGSPGDPEQGVGDIQPVLSLPILRMPLSTVKIFREDGSYEKNPEIPRTGHRRGVRRPAE